ncbi:hypothetical protein [Paraburkholderia fungorum]|uniref:hypothetical protein n=1 Tax=Paraburkholderia fungorum TaxID=134537 RepID=UPI0038BE14C5
MATLEAAIVIEDISIEYLTDYSAGANPAAPPSTPPIIVLPAVRPTAIPTRPQISPTVAPISAPDHAAVALPGDASDGTDCATGFSSVVASFYTSGPAPATFDEAGFGGEIVRGHQISLELKTFLNR